MKLLFLTHAATAPAINSAPRFTQRCLVPESFTPTERTRVVREPHRGVYDRQEIYKILDEGIVCHVGFIADAQPFVIPTLYARAGDAIYFEALHNFTEKILPGRWEDARQPNEKELKATSILKLPLAEISAKVRSGPVLDDEEDYALPVWAGIVPLHLQSEAPIRDERCDPAIPTPAYAANYRR